jgi:hypothetical protein
MNEKRDTVSKKMIGAFVMAALLLTILGGCGGGSKPASAGQPAPVPQIKTAVTNPEMFAVGNGKIGLFHKNMSVAEAKRMITGTYGGRFEETKEPAGEGTTANVINAYFAGAPDKQPSLKFTLTSKGDIYRIEALSAEFKAAKGLHVGSAWPEIRQAYPQAKVTVEGVVAFFAPENVTCRLKAKTTVDWWKKKGDEATPPDDLTIVSIYTY